MNYTDSDRTVPHVGVKWPSCPHCDHYDADRTFTRRHHRHEVRGTETPACYAKCSKCGAGVVIEHWQADDGW